MLLFIETNMPLKHQSRELIQKQTCHKTQSKGVNSETNMP
jgi:hypothetical protein